MSTIMSDVEIQQPVDNDDSDQITESEALAQADENYKLYKRRWLVLTAMFSISLVVGLNRSIISIADLINTYMNMTHQDYYIMAQISAIALFLFVLPVAKSLEYFGLRRMAYFACFMILCANGFKTLSCDDTYVNQWIKDHRYWMLVLSEGFLGLANCVALCVPAKVASAWFANYENTLALVIAFCGYNIGVSSRVLVTFIVLSCITRSSPKIPPSENALLSANSPVSLITGLSIIIKNHHLVILIVTLTLNLATLNTEQFILEDILKSENYSNSFCGTLIAHSYFFGTFFMLMGAAWLDNASDHVKVSRITSLICAVFITCFNISLCFSGLKSLILITNLMAALGCSLMYPALLQVAIKSTRSIFPEAGVSAIVIISQQIITVAYLNLMTPLRNITRFNDYKVPLIVLSFLILLLNSIYIFLFEIPKREDLNNLITNSEEEPNEDLD